MAEILVAYFSASGQTAKLAQTITDVTGGDLHEIKPEVPYTKADLNWKDKNSRSSLEMNDPGSRPSIANRVENMDKYDIIFLGFPIWWYVAPTIIHTFLESYDFTGKTVIPFATSGGSDMGRTDSILQTICSKETGWKPGKRMNSGESAASVQSWIESLKL
ncbi:MAG: NAD(P)H-dependent oxidoreductase [Erysipelotrichaceae bacterium]|nr:NAD(P)H-dependent oxidoreductase [Erysipelotrichaceae bacterium]